MQKTTVYVYDFQEESPRLILTGNDLYDALSGEYSEFPSGAYLYRGKEFSEDNRVSFVSEKEKLEAVDYTGEFSLVFMPHDPITIVIGVVAGLALLATVAMMTMKPKIPNNLNQSANQSSNNSLAERENQQRLGGLVPEIFGTVLATPDLISVPYTVYKGSQEIEYSVMCIGRGRYTVDTDQIYDDTTPIKRISGASVDIYETNASVNNPFDSEKYATSANKFDDVVWETKKCNAVNGQTLLPPNSGTVNGDTRLYFQAVGTVYSVNSQIVDGLGVDFTEHFQSGDTIAIANQNGVVVNRFIVTSAQSAITFNKTGTTYKITESISWLSWGNIVSAGQTIIVTGTASGTYDGTYTVSSISGSDLFISGSSPTNPSAWPTGTSAFQSATIQYPDKTFNFNGTYTVLSVDKSSMNLTLTTGQKAIWDVLKNLSAEGTTLGNVINTPTDPINAIAYKALNTQAMQIQTSKTRWSQVFVIEGNGINNIICNFSCPNGLYATTDQQYSNTVGVQVSVFPCDINGTILSGYTEQLEDLTLQGTSQSTSSVYGTLRCNLYQSWWKAGGLSIGSDAKLLMARRAILAVWTENVDPSTPLWITRIRYNDSGNPNSPDNKRGDQVIIATYDGTSYGTWGRNYESTGSNPATSNMYPYKAQRPVWVTVYKETATNSGVIDTTTNQKIHLLIDYRMFDTLVTTQVVEYSSTATTPNDYLTLNSNVFTGGGFSRVGVKVRRSTDKNYDGKGQYTDETKIKDIFVQSAFTGEDFGNVTTVYCKTLGTEGALSLKKRKLNILATRAIRCYDKDGDYINANGTKYTGSASLAPYLATNRIDHILVNVLREPLLGNVPLAQIDTPSLYDMTKKMSQYFGEGDTWTTGSTYPLITSQTSFNYTFDKADMSLYDMVKAVSATNDITVYGELNQFMFFFEYSGMPASMLFNHRNKMPKSQTRTVSFGSRESYDGIELDWVNPNHYDSKETFKIPYTGSALNPLKVELVGIRNERQAFISAWRAYFKMKYQTIVDEFEALPEAMILAKGMRFYSTDNTRSNVYDGEIVSRSGFVLELSQPVDLSLLTNPYIYIQHKDATIQSLPITQGVDLYHVVYSGTLTNSLITDPDYYAQNTYQIWGDEDYREKSFILEERSPSEGDSQHIKGLLYDPLFYTADQMTFWFQPLTQGCIDRTFNHRDPIAVNGVYIRSESSRGWTFYNAQPSGYCKFDSANPLTTTNEFTMFSWFKLDTSLTIPTGTDFHIFSSTNTTSIRLCLSRGSSTYSLKGIRGATTDTVLSTLITSVINEWNCATLTQQITQTDGSGNPTEARLNLFLNGVLVDTALVTPTPASNLYFGGNGTSTGGFKGWLDTTMLFNDNMTPTEVRSLYLATLGITATNKF